MKERVEAVLEWLAARATEQDRANLERFGIGAKKAVGVSMKNIQALGKELGRDPELAAALWETGLYEARLLCAFVDDPKHVTAAQMESWCQEFDNWGICDTVCFKLFDQAGPRWEKAREWCGREAEFEKRAGFALLASLALHDKKAGDGGFIEGLEWIEREAGDGRNFVKKGVSWALRSIGRRNAALGVAAGEVALRLAASRDAAARWVGKEAVREFRRLKAEGV
jgi:3-methyladenine DNA glycosylase AlkD